jgi:hypothetical protein
MENLLGIRHVGTAEKLRTALLAIPEMYDNYLMIGWHRYKTPAGTKARQLAAAKAAA